MSRVGWTHSLIPNFILQIFIEHLPSVAKRTVKETVEPAADKFVRASGNGRRDGRKSANSKMNMVE